jgi:uncharacterized RDD family membrane protein YckC
MSCPLCGELCHCPSEPRPEGPPRSKPDRESRPRCAAPENPGSEQPLVDPQARDLGPPRFAASRENCAEHLEPSCNLASHLAGEAARVADRLTGAWSTSDTAEAPSSVLPDPSASAWRDELSARLDRYRARRKAQPPRYPSLRLPFAPDLPGSGASTPARDLPSVFESASHHALALDLPNPPPPDEAYPDRRADTEAAPQRPQRATAKIIEFPRFACGPPAPPPDQLAEPVSDRPRILDVPEVAPPPPALGGITIEAAESQEAEKRPGIDVPLESASIARRIVASGIDGVIIAIASAMFGAIFRKVAPLRPPTIQLLCLTAGIPCLLWAAYHYLLLVYGGSTPGLFAAGLELARFDGSFANRRLRRWRVLASYLSAASLGMGYAWLFLDEDALCWHDRITQTYLAPRKGRGKGPQP